MDGQQKTLLVHRKGATRAFPPHHPLIPAAYQFTGGFVRFGLVVLVFSTACGRTAVTRLMTLPPLHAPAPPCTTPAAGQPVLIGGTMGTCSYVLTGTQRGMDETFGSTCHGAGRARSRNQARNQLDYQQVCVGGGVG